ncbi:MAG: hypothetical protein K6L81_01735 [Agarilytica sp.]
MIAILEGTESANTVEFMHDDYGERLLFNTYKEANEFLEDEATPGRTYQMWADGSHEGND